MNSKDSGQETHPFNEAFIALGSNLDNPQNQVNIAVDALAMIPETQVTAQSSWYQTAAVGPGEQPDYINGVIRLATRLSAFELFKHTQAIEAQQGRERRVRWAARTLDLDILLFGNQIIATSQLQIPHPRLKERNFVIYPLAEIQPDLQLPDGEKIASLLVSCSSDGIMKLA